MAYADKEKERAYHRAWEAEHRSARWHEDERYRAYQQAYQREYAKRSREKKRAERRAFYHRRKAWMQEEKGTTCHGCGGTFEPRQLHWHHRDPSTKLFAIGIRVASYGRERIAAEMAKCDVLCELCHSKEHARIKRGD
jgi:hypothetical protein